MNLFFWRKNNVKIDEQKEEIDPYAGCHTPCREKDDDDYFAKDGDGFYKYFDAPADD